MVKLAIWNWQGRIQGGGGQRGLLTPLQKLLVYQDRDTLIEQSL